MNPALTIFMKYIPFTTSILREDMQLVILHESAAVL